MAELDLTAIAGSSISVPAAGVAAVYVDATNKTPKVKDDAGYVRGDVNNFSTVSQAPTATVRTYITGSAIAAPSTKFQIGTIFRWRFNMTKTAAGVAASTIDICFGTSGTTADTARVSFTKPAGTAAVDEGECVVTAIVRGPLTSACVVTGEFTLLHNGNTVGHATIPVACVNTLSAGFDITTPGLIAGLCITTGAADAITIQQILAEGINL